MQEVALLAADGSEGGIPLDTVLPGADTELQLSPVPTWRPTEGLAELPTPMPVARDAPAADAAVGSNGTALTEPPATEMGMFGKTGLSDCNKRSIYDRWGATFQAAYPSWRSVCPEGALNASAAANRTISSAAPSSGGDAAAGVSPAPVH